ncbi:MAG: FRG domain-containing protein [Syntrophaceae bacterium]|nr:FRG domain-containing protein [Syntrophaceae bacterium]
MDGWYHTRHCKGWNDFLQKVRTLPKNMVYRGQSDHKRPLMSSFDRAAKIAQPLVRRRWMYEAAILREFKRRAHHYVFDTPKWGDNLEWLALMRHFGAPTRLVDFTYSHYIAAYFAFSDLGCKDRAVWAIDQKWLSSESKKRCLKIMGVKRGEIELDIPEHFTKCLLDPNRKPVSSRYFVAAVNAERMNKRLTIQQGCFLCQGDIERSFEKSLSSMVPRESLQKHIFKFVIPHSSRNRALKDLKHMNITKASLFPDLGGLAESLNDRFELLFRDYEISEKTLTKVVTWSKARDSGGYSGGADGDEKGE